jgi:DNA-binding IclR family transcriptional regulator
MKENKVNKRTGGASTTSEAKQDRFFVTALARGLEILRCFNAKRTELGTMDISHLTGLPQPTVWRLCHTLLRLGYLTRSAGSDKLRLSIGVLSLGYASLSSINISDSALHDMQQLADDFHAASSIAIPDGLDMVLVKRAQCDSAVLVVNLHVGARLPIAYSSFGGAYLAVLPPGQREQLIKALKSRHERNWPHIWKNISAAIDRYNKRGYIVNRGVYHPQINAVAIPVASEDFTQILAINCGGPATVLSARALENDVTPRLLSIAEKIRNDLYPASKSVNRRVSRFLP